MIKKSTIALRQERLDLFRLAFALDFENNDFASVEIDSAIVCVLDVFFKEGMLWMLRAKVLDLKVESFINIVDWMHLRLVEKSTEENLIGFLNIAQVCKTVKARLQSMLVIERRSNLIAILRLRNKLIESA